MFLKEKHRKKGLKCLKIPAYVKMDALEPKMEQTGSKTGQTHSKTG